MNVIPIDLGYYGDAVRAVHEAFELTLPNGDRFTARPPSATFGVRPEDVSLAANAPADVQTFEAEVSVTEPLGESLLIHCYLGTDELHIKTEARSAITPGDTLELAVDEDRLHVFDDAGDAIYHSSVREAAASDTVYTTPEP